MNTIGKRKDKCKKLAGIKVPGRQAKIKKKTVQDIYIHIFFNVIKRFRLSELSHHMFKRRSFKVVV